MTEPNAAQKLCECGCGEPTRVAKANDPRHGHVKGQGVRFLKGHSHRGKVVSDETRAKLSASSVGANAGNWKGDEASYRAIHGYLCKHYPKSGVCEECGNTAAKTHYAVIHGHPYTRNCEDYRELCVPCHMRYDLGGRPVSPETAARSGEGRRRRWEQDRLAGTMPQMQRGEDRPMAKLTEASVAEIRQLRAQGFPVAQLARGYGVSRATIRDAVARRTWAHVL